ncbi:hypothetical protein OJ997_27295 [Solirubrobacter phytolaccae]|uniref:Uncharacterized protein n=1 Tax=Solirubrobacter phytolaccae TaxID=1404360 RepID=A0A9X3NEV7_9ACTN|nr:hypothetical protein [Solirubrobacter phytolaccae]MDA0184044.1 hypothetical protein [Solirubrobacter phytolaccae]
MHPDRTADPAHLAGTARGLGVCDVLRVELTAHHRPALERALAARTGVLEHAIRARATRSKPSGEAAAPTEDPELPRLREELRLLARVGATLPAPAAGPFVLLGPAGLVLELVGEALQATVRELAAGMGSASGTAGLEAARAWITTALDCRAVDGFALDVGVDPLHAW